MKNNKITDCVRLKHIVEAIEHIEMFLADTNEEEYLMDLKLQAAIERKIEIIGEAANHLSVEITTKYPDIEWAKLKAFRNMIAHEYFGVSNKIIWESATKRIPMLKHVVIQLLNELNE